MRIALAALCLAMTAAAAVLAAQTQQQAPQVFRSGVQVATVYAQVVDNRGEPIRDLTPADFTVRINGTPQPVVAATFFAAPPMAGSPAGPAPSGRERTNLDAAGGPDIRPRTLVILIDDLSYRFTSGDLMTIRNAATNVLKQLAPSDFVGLATTSGIGPQIAPTTDRAIVAAAIVRAGGRLDDSLPGGIYFTFEEAHEVFFNPEGHEAVAAMTRECKIEEGGWRPKINPQLCSAITKPPALDIMNQHLQRAGWQVRSYIDVASVLAMLPGPKTLVVFSDGIPTGFGATPALELSRFGRIAAEAGVQVYAVTGFRDDVQITEKYAERARARSKEHAAFQNGVENIAGAAGGKTMRMAGTVERLFDRILTETSGIYELRVELPLSNRQRALNASVTVRRSGASVLANKQVIATNIAAEPVSVDQEFDRMLQNAVPAAAVPLSMAASIRRSPSGAGLEVGVNAALPPAVPRPLKVKFVLFNEITKSLSSRDVQVPDGPDTDRFAFAVGLAPGRYQLRLGVMDAAGNIGTVMYPIRARLTPVGNWFASDLQMSWDDGTGKSRFLALEGLPDSATTVGLQLELYAAAAGTTPPDTTVVVELTSLDLKKSIAKRDVPVRIENDRALVRAAVPVQSLEPGVYALRALVMEQGRETGVLVTSFRKSTPAIAAADAGAPPAAAALPTADEALAALSEDAKSAWPAPSMPSLVSRSLVQAHLLALAKSVGQGLAGAVADPAAPDAAFWEAFGAVPVTTRAVGPFARGVVALRAGEADLAGSLFQRAQTQAPSSISVVVYLGAALAAAKQLPDAAGAWQLAVGDPAVEVEWHVALADVLAQIKERDAAVSVLQEARGRWPDSPVIASRLVQHALAAGDIAAARTLLSRLDAAPAEESFLFWATALAYADALGSRSPEAIAAFRAVAERYLKTDANRAELVRRLLERLRNP